MTPAVVRGAARAWLAFFVALLCGAGAGLLAAKARWGYFFTIPRVAVPSATTVDAIAFIRFGEPERPFSHDEHQNLLRSEIAACNAATPECTFGRTLVSTRHRDWDSVPLLSGTESEALVREALAGRQPPFRMDRGPVLAMAAKLREGENSRYLVAMDAVDLSADDDHHGYAEWLIGNDRRIQDFATYYFDVAGIEFATPAVLMTTGSGLTALLIGLVLLIRRVLRRLKTQQVAAQ